MDPGDSAPVDMALEERDGQGKVADWVCKSEGVSGYVCAGRGR